MVGVCTCFRTGGSSPTPTLPSPREAEVGGRGRGSLQALCGLQCRASGRLSTSLGTRTQDQGSFSEILILLRTKSSKPIHQDSRGRLGLALTGVGVQLPARLGVLTPIPSPEPSTGCHQLWEGPPSPAARSHIYKEQISRTFQPASDPAPPGRGGQRPLASTSLRVCGQVHPLGLSAGRTPPAGAGKVAKNP